MVIARGTVEEDGGDLPIVTEVFQGPREGLLSRRIHCRVIAAQRALRILIAKISESPARIPALG
jgi:hypothetical protein